MCMGIWQYSMIISNLLAALSTKKVSNSASHSSIFGDRPQVDLSLSMQNSNWFYLLQVLCSSLQLLGDDVLTSHVLFKSLHFAALLSIC